MLLAGFVTPVHEPRRRGNRHVSGRPVAGRPSAVEKSGS